jgi:hypothetical protein
MLALTGCAPKTDTGTPPANAYTRVFELYHPNRNANSYSEWKCVAELAEEKFRKEYSPTENIGIGNNGIRIIFTMDIPIYANAEYTFTTSYKVDGVLVTNVDRSVLSQRK